MLQKKLNLAVSGEYLKTCS